MADCRALARARPARSFSFRRGGTDDWLQLAQPVSDDPHPGVRAQRRVDVAPARRAGGVADAVEGRQRGRRGAGRRGRDHGRRAPCRAGRRRCVRARVGRRAAVRAERVGRRAGRMERRLFPQAPRRGGQRHREQADARLGHRHRAGRDRGLGSAACEVRFAAVRGPARTGDRDRGARLCGAADRRAQVGGRGAGTQGVAGFRGHLHAAWPRTAGGRARVPAGPCADVAHAAEGRCARVLRGALAERIAAFSREGGARWPQPTCRLTGPNGSSRSASASAVTRSTRFRRTGRASPR